MGEACGASTKGKEAKNLASWMHEHGSGTNASEVPSSAPMRGHGTESNACVGVSTHCKTCHGVRRMRQLLCTTALLPTSKSILPRCQKIVRSGKRQTRHQRPPLVARNILPSHSQAIHEPSLERKSKTLDVYNFNKAIRPLDGPLFDLDVVQSSPPLEQIFHLLWSSSRRI